jgi:murein DD-endopeptidase MepM/ murein hydrolase activator NlpD
MLGAETFNQTFDVELARTLSRAGGFGLSQWLMNTFDALERASTAAESLNAPASSSAPAATSTSSSASSEAPNAAPSNTTSAATSYTGRTGWNGLRLEVPMAGNSGAQWAGFNEDRAMAGGDDSSVKDAFFRWTYGLNFNPAGKSKPEIEAYLKDNLQSAREYGLNIVDVQGEQILVETEERGLEWVDVVVNAGSSNPGETKWQWLTMMESGMPTGGGALGTALADLRSAAGAEGARSFMMSNNLTGNALLASIQSEAAAARTGGGGSRQTVTPTTPEDLTRPSGQVTSNYGWRQDPFTGATTFHRGVDLRGAEGDPVLSTGAGRVVFAGSDGGYGTSVIVEHADGLRSMYAHLSALLVSVGDQVTQGQRIGLVGQTGRATAPHLHYEVMADGRAVNPLR